MNPSEIIRVAGAQWIGQMLSDRDGVLILFRDPVTGSSCSVPLRGLSVERVREKLDEKRALFGGKS